MPRKIGIGVAMIIPTFVAGGLLWNLFHNWYVIIALIIVAGFVWTRIAGSVGEEEHAH
jgi:hypothetical protein